MSSRRIIRSFAFIDLCGFIGFMDEHGDDAAIAALTELRAITRRAAEQYGVRIAKWLGDGALIVGMEHEPVLDCVLEIQRETERRLPIPGRAGVSSGPVLLLDGDDYIGWAINVAARLCAAAAPGQVLIADGEESASAGGRLIRVRGMADPIPIHELEPAAEPVGSAAGGSR